MADVIELGATVSFEVYPSKIYGNVFQNVVVESILDSEDCRFYGFVAAVEHARVYGTLPAGTPDDPTKYRYYKVRFPDNSVRCIGIPWIKPESVVIKRQLTATIVIENITTDDIPLINAALSSNGYVGKVTVN